MPTFTRNEAKHLEINSEDALLLLIWPQWLQFQRMLKEQEAEEQRIRQQQVQEQQAQQRALLLQYEADYLYMGHFNDLIMMRMNRDTMKKWIAKMM